MSAPRTEPQGTRSSTGQSPRRPRQRDHDNEVERAEDPRKGRGSRGYAVVHGVRQRTPAIDLELVADVDHDEAQAQHREQSNENRDRGVSLAQGARQQLGHDQAPDQQYREEEYAFHISLP